MSLFNLPLGSVEEIAAKITNSTATTIVDGTDQAWYVPKLAVGENAGGTPSLTVDLYDGTTAYCQVAEGSLWSVKPVTAKQGVVFYDLFVPKNWVLRITSSDAAGKFDVTGVAARVTKVS